MDTQSEQEKIQSQTQAGAELPTNITYASAMEKRDPDVRSKVIGIISEVGSKLKSGLMSPNQVTREFHSLTVTAINGFAEKKYINSGTHNAKGYTQQEVALMLYIKTQGNNLTSRMIKDLKKIILEEFDKISPQSS